MKYGNELSYQLKIVLKGSKPAIWRRLLVQGNTDLHSLHQIIQLVMGWGNLHPYRFEINGVNYGLIDTHNDFNGLHFEDSRNVKLSKVINSEKSKILYEYDFGDSWEHEIYLEKIVPFTDRVHYPNLISGKQSCPPENCGGLGGYTRLLKSAINPIEEEYERMIDTCKAARILK